ncbi:Root adhesin [Salinivirga cyanobacteriivorans]|uniref:Root adhesin n=2 Tax=Salinivirga cyanobacteriivorans TaxID=1307839 RepID=A0A0S2I0T6_9BACT|nr:Root adhesin [Salinivirga cyanobacteriivorans]
MCLNLGFKINIMQIHRTLTIIFITFLSFSLLAQEKSFENQFLTAESFIQEQNFAKALEILKPLINKQPKNANLHFKVGFCYLQSSYQKKQAISHLKKAAANTTEAYDPENPEETSAPLETPVFLARALYHNHEFDKADSIYKQFKTSVADLANEAYLQELNRLIELNQNAKNILNNPIDVEISQFRQGINTPAIEYAPVISGDEQTLIFTSNRKSNEVTDINHSDDLYITHKNDDEKWSAPEKMTNVSTPYNEASTSLSFDGNTLVIYMNDDGDGELYQSQWDGNKWSTPEIMPDPINSPELETHGCFSPDMTEFFYASSRPGGYGGLDIYVTRKLPTGIWGAAENLGPEINTPENEDSPFIHPDNKRLYFSSAGHKTMGGLDIFVTSRQNTNDWNKVQNIGYPINSTADDVCFSVSADGKRGYYASFNEKSLGETDLFMILMPGEDHTPLMVYVGYAKNKAGEVIKGAEITAFNDRTGEMFGTYTPNQRTGKFVLAAEEGTKLQLLIEADGYKSIERTITIKNTDENENTLITQEVPMKDIELENVWKIPENIFMPFDSFETDMSAYGQLVAFLQQNTAVNVKLTGHTDAKGPDWYNKKLGLKRARFVKNYLTEKNINPSRIATASMGEKAPIARNEMNGKDAPEGRKFNRRVAIELLNANPELFELEETSIPGKLIIRKKK